MAKHIAKCPGLYTNRVLQERYPSIACGRMAFKVECEKKAMVTAKSELGAKTTEVHRRAWKGDVLNRARKSELKPGGVTMAEAQ